jgi:glutamate carboxypeptidase
MTPEQRAVLGEIRADTMLANTLEWVAINSGTRNLPGLASMAEALAESFSTLPGGVTLVDPEPAEIVTATGAVEPLDHGQHLHLRVRPEAPVQLLFTGHMDTVYGADHPFQSARWKEDGTLNGPGAADMKGGLAVMLAALQAVETSPAATRLGYEVVINSDEETGSFASRNLIAQAAAGKLAAFTYEPALPDGTLAGARGGTGNFSLVVRGRSAHAGRNPEEGRNALVAAAGLAVQLAALASPALSVNPARIEGGGPNNVVPDLAILRVNFRPRSLEAIAAAQEAMEGVVQSVRDLHDVEITIHGSFNRAPKPVDAKAERLLHLVRETGTLLGLDIRWQATGGVCDGNNIAACGVPVVDTMGVRGGAIHSAEEYLIPDSLYERAALSALSILRIAELGRL